MQAPFRILLIEDNDADVFLVQTALEESGLQFELAVCSDGEEAIRTVAQIQSGKAPCPDLLLLDMNLPKFGGDEILGFIEAGAGDESYSVVVITSSDSPVDRAQATAFGVDYYFRKPADLEQFLKLGEIVRATLLSRAERRAP